MIIKIGHCNSCKFWNRQDKENENCNCSFMKMENFDWEQRKRKIKEVKMYAFPECPHDGFAVNFYTSSTFGCIHHKRKKGYENK